MANDIVSRDNIRTGIKVEGWEGAVRAAGDILVSAGSIEPLYIEEMIAAVHELGPYMVIMPGFALAHARPSPAVLRNDMSLVVLDTPVEFGCENDPVSVVLCIACTDTASHTASLTAVANALLDESIFDKLALAKSPDEVCALLRGE